MDFISIHVVTKRHHHDSLWWSILDYINLLKAQGIFDSQNDLLAWPAQKYRTSRGLYYATHVDHYWFVFLKNEPQEVKEHSIFVILSDLKFQWKVMPHKSVQIYEYIIKQARNHVANRGFLSLVSCGQWNAHIYKFWSGQFQSTPFRASFSIIVKQNGLSLLLSD